MDITDTHSDSLLVAIACMTALVTLRVFIFRWVAQSQKRSFHAIRSLRKLLQVFGSFLIPGLGQATQGRFEVATLHITLFGVLWFSTGWFAVPLQIASALECVRK
jgi:hypothetical protein